MIRVIFSVTAAIAVASLSQVRASVVSDMEPNNLVTTAQNIDAYFSLDFSPDIGNTTTNTSTSIPHVTVDGTGDNTLDFFSFTVSTPGSRGIFDVDYGQAFGGAFDPWIELYTSTGTFLAFSDDFFPMSVGQGGSVHPHDSYLEYFFATTRLVRHRSWAFS